MAKKITNYIQDILVDTNDDIFVLRKVGYKTAYVLKLNSSGNQIEEELIENSNNYFVRIWYLNDLFVYNEIDGQLLCYDLNLNLKWNSSFLDYISTNWIFQTFLVKDSEDNLCLTQYSGGGNINLVKINSTGNFSSRIIWGQGIVSDLYSLNIDLEDNLYIICSYVVYDFWNSRYEYRVLVKNPVDGDGPPVPRRGLDDREHFLFSVIGISCIISPISLILLLKRKKKR